MKKKQDISIAIKEISDDQLRMFITDFLTKHYWVKTNNIVADMIRIYFALTTTHPLYNTAKILFNRRVRRILSELRDKGIIEVYKRTCGHYTYQSIELFNKDKE